MKFRCCNCENIFSNDEVLEESTVQSEEGFSCPNCQANIKECASKESSIKGINYVIATFVIGVVGNTMWGNKFHEATGYSWLIASFGLFILSIIVVILLNLTHKEPVITQTELVVKK